MYQACQLRRLASLALAVCFSSPAFGGQPQNASSPAAPSIEYVLPWRVAAGAPRVRVTVHGNGFDGCSVVGLRRERIARDVPAQLVNGNLVFTLPEDLTATPGKVALRVGEGSVSSAEVGLEVVEAKGHETADPFISKVSPDEVTVSSGRETRLLLQGEYIDPKALVFLRPEGRSTDGVRLANVRAPVASQIEVRLPPDVTPTSDAYEIRVVNPTARVSNWVRVTVRVRSGE